MPPGLAQIGLPQAPTRSEWTDGMVRQTLTHAQHSLTGEKKQALDALLARNAAMPNESILDPTEWQQAQQEQQALRGARSALEIHAIRASLQTRSCKIPGQGRLFEQYPALLQSSCDFQNAIAPHISAPPDVPSITGEQLQEAIRFEVHFAKVIAGLVGDPQYELPFQDLANSGNLWSWSLLDWTVLAQPYDDRFPWRGFCDGPPGESTATDLIWGPLTPADCIFYPFESWHVMIRARVCDKLVEHLTEEHKNRIRKAETLLALARSPKFDFAVRAIPRWQLEFDVNDLIHPLPFHLLHLVFLRLQRKLRDLQGLINYLDAMIRRVQSRDGVISSKVLEYVGVQYQRHCPDADLQAWADVGMPVLEAVHEAHDLPPCVRNHTMDMLRARQMVSSRTREPRHAVSKESKKRTTNRPSTAHSKKKNRAREAIKRLSRGRNKQR